MNVNQLVKNGNVHRDLEATLAVVLVADGHIERAIEQASWERRGVLRRLVRDAAPAGGILATDTADATRRAA